jgi:hypothetical protein
MKSERSRLTNTGKTQEGMDSNLNNVYCLEVPLTVCSTIIKNVSSFEHVTSRYSENARFLLLSTCSTCPIMVVFFVCSQF